MKEKREVRKTNIEKVITKLRKRELEEKLKAKKKEKLQVNINPDSLIGREIRYQTALLHEILRETEKQTMILERNEGKSPVSNHNAPKPNTE